MKSIIPFNLSLLALIFILSGSYFSLPFVVLAIAILENSVFLSGLTFNLNKPVKKDFRFQYAGIASRFYYPISVILLYVFYMGFRFYYKEQISVDSFDLVYLLIVILLFCIFRLISQELIDYVESKNLYNTKEIIPIRNTQQKKKEFKSLLLSEANMWQSLSNDLEVVGYLRNLITTIEYSSKYFDENIYKESSELTSLLKRDQTSKEEILLKVKNIMGMI